jgi:hypothetical protein
MTTENTGVNGWVIVDFTREESTDGTQLIATLGPCVPSELDTGTRVCFVGGSWTEVIQSAQDFAEKNSFADYIMDDNHDHSG